MISFVIIGRNEGWKLPLCLTSVFRTIEVNALSKYEVIYVDSKSTDVSMKNAKKFKELKIIQLTGDINAAIARNIGAKESKGDVLFFIDGDMELIPGFLPLVYSEEKGLYQDFVSGNWINYYYDQKNNFISKSPYLNMNKDMIEKVTGGLFLIKSYIWERIGGMRNVFKKSQDIDLGLRLAKQGSFLYRKKEIAAKHHTVAYMDKKRMWEDLWYGNHLYGSSLLYRKNIFNKYMYQRLLRNDYSMIFLTFSLLINILVGGGVCFVFYVLLISIRSRGDFNKIIYYLLRDTTIIFGIVLFFPYEKKLISNKLISR